MDAPPQIVIARPAEAQMLPSPIPRDWILAGDPQARVGKLSRSADKAAETVVWETTAGTFRWRFALDETVKVLEGEVFVTDDHNREHRLGPGDVAYFPAGSESLWRVPDRLRKIAFVRHDMPTPVAYMTRAWNWAGTRFAQWRPWRAKAQPTAAVAAPSPRPSDPTPTGAIARADAGLAPRAESRDPAPD